MLFRSLCVILAAFLPMVSSLYAKGVDVKIGEDEVTIVNRTRYALDGLRYGEHRISAIGPGETQRFAPTDGTLSGGRFRLSQWSKALMDTSQTLSAMHLITAGVHPDALEPGLAGDPLSSINVKRLSTYRGATISCGLSPSPQCLGLLAHASIYLPIEHLANLLKTSSPDAQDPYPVGYVDLPSVADSLRDAFEQRGPFDLAGIHVPAPWLFDRGLSAPILLKTLGMKVPQGFRSIRIARDFDGAYQAILAAYKNGDEDAAAGWSVEAWRLHNPKQFTAAQRRIVCSGFDAGAAHHQAKAQFVASFAYLMLLATHCDDTPSQRERFADWFSAQGREAFARLRLEAARVLFERAYFFDSSPKTEAELADTLAELAILRFREGELKIARTYLEKASRIAAFRPKVLAAQDADPGANKRAKIGIIIIICFISFFVVRRLRRVWFGDLSGRRRTRDSL